MTGASRAADQGEIAACDKLPAMRVLLAPAGSRGDFQPMLALAHGFLRAGHEVLLVSSASFADEARAFGVPFVSAGLDVDVVLRSWADRGELTPARGTWELLRAGRELIADGIAELARARRAHGLAPVRSVEEHVLPRKTSLLASDPELHPLPPDITLAHAPFGSFHLPDERPLPQDLESFLSDGPPPVYLGFGSMPDAQPERTAALVLEAIERAGVRAIVSAGWAGLSSERAPPSVRFVGAISHRLLFPRVRATVHHGGAGTTAASAFAGRPQLVVHHAFDQLRNGVQVHRAGVGLAPLARVGLDARKLAEALRALVSDEAMRERAARVGAQIAARDAVGDAVRFFERRHRA
jgi:vancomycin aglycone glucosyltransferase